MIIVGYHFTTTENYRKIRKEGLIPYPIVRAEMRDPKSDFLSVVKEGIFIWLNNQKRLDRKLNISYQSQKPGKKSIVCLQVEVDENDILKQKGDDILYITHSWKTRKLEQIPLKEQLAVLAMKPIKPENIKLLRRFPRDEDILWIKSKQ